MKKTSVLILFLAYSSGILGPDAHGKEYDVTFESLGKIVEEKNRELEIQVEKKLQMRLVENLEFKRKKNEEGIDS